MALYGEQADLDQVATRSPSNTLTAFKRCNCEDPSARSVLHHNFPAHYVHDKSAGKWTRRSDRSQPAVGRMYLSTPRDGERYFLRALLCHVTGPTCQDDLLMVEVSTYAYNSAATIQFNDFAWQHERSHLLAAILASADVGICVPIIRLHAQQSADVVPCIHAQTLNAGSPLLTALSCRNTYYAPQPQCRLCVGPSLRVLA